jgi:adenylate cyclase
MEGQTRQELAERSGVDIAYVDRLLGLGILQERAEGFTHGDVRRVRVVESLDRAGLPLDSLAEALRQGVLSLDFVDQPSYDRFAALSSVTFRELAERTSIPLEIVLAIREAMGFAEPDPDDRVRESELLVIPMLEVEVEAGVRPATIERSLRVFGDSLRRVAQSEADWWRNEILMPLFRGGMSGAEIGRQTESLATAIADKGDQALLAIFHGQQANAWMRNIFEGFETVLERAGLHARIERPPAICFLDLTGYSRLTEERGDEVAADLTGRLARLVQRTSAEHGGTPVKYLGDGVMFFFHEPGSGVQAALDMVEGAADAGLPPAHVGLHAGPVLYQEGDYFGRTVNAAARIADYARQGEVLVSQAVVEAADVAGVRFAEIGPVELKGLAGPLRLHSAHRTDG